MITKLKENLASIAISLIIILVVISYLFPDKVKPHLDNAKENLNEIKELILGGDNEEDDSGIIDDDDVPVIELHNEQPADTSDSDNQQDGQSTDESLTDFDEASRDFESPPR